MNIWGAVIYGIVVVASYIYAFKKDKEKGKKGLQKGWKQFLKQLPFVFSIFLLIGLFDVFIPKSVVVSVVGRGRGFLAILNAALVGSVVGGPVSSVYPLGAVLLKKGATLAVAAVFMNAWIMVGFISMPFEISIFGKKFVFVRNVLAFIGAIIIGMLTGLILTGSAI
jgi:uncharacterized membrane protein YraQ (UPF0718 family)